MDTSRLKDINADLASKRTELDRHENVLAATSKVSDTVLFSTISLIKYLEGHVTKTEVTNQLKTIGTPDALKVVTAVNQLHQTLKTHKNTDLTEVTKVMKGILDEAKKLPKDLPKIPETKVVDYSKQFSSLTDAIKAVEKVVKEQKLVAEAPIVNVPETNVNVDAPDLEPLQSSIKDVIKAVNDIVIPEYITDNKEVEKLLKASNKLLKNILEKPVGGGGGGGGSSWMTVNTTGIPVPVELTADGSVPVDASGFKLYDIEEDTTSYYGKTNANGDYLIEKVTATLVSYATESNNGSVTSYTNAWTNRATLTFGRYDEAF